MEKTTPHYAHPTGFALGLTSGILYSVCAAAIKLWPVQTMQFFNDWMHGIDLSRLFVPKALTLGVFIRGLVEIVLTFYVAGALYGWLYNKCVAHCQRKGWI